ncbi:polysaccharide deacetylase family protein [Streptomyces lusitanus]|uniref:polysaccharide deacetylase family protein n=1 Tax=Streptomyces lusitanus TaxID=68232 RepID=UPI00363D60BD
MTAVPGSSVQNHSVSHRDLSTLPLAEQQAEICDARDAAARVYGTPTTVFRPPYLAFNADTLQAAANCGIRTVVTATADFSWGASNVWHGGPLQAGDVVLMHFTDTLAADLQRALAAARAAGLRRPDSPSTCTDGGAAARTGTPPTSCPGPRRRAPPGRAGRRGPGRRSVPAGRAVQMSDDQMSRVQLLLVIRSGQAAAENTGR